MPAESPFVPGTRYQYAWDSVSLGLLKECPRKYKYTMIDGWQSRGEAVHLRFGGLFASALERYHKLRAQEWEYDDAVDCVVYDALNATWDNREYRWGEGYEGKEDIKVEVLDTGHPWDSGHDKKTRWNLIRSIVWYLEEYKEDPAETLILPDGRPAVELSYRLEIDHFAPDGTPYLLCGHMDRVVSFLGQNYVQDQKTSGSALGPYFFRQFEPDNQMSGYTFASKVVYNEPVAGVIIDGVEIGVGFTRFGRAFTLRSQGQIEEWLSDTKSWLDLSVRYADLDYWPMNDKSCHKYNGCQFREVCSADPAVRQNFLETKFEKRFWNPLETR